MAQVPNNAILHDLRDFATSYRSNARNIENPWYPAYQLTLIALSPAGSNLVVRCQQEIPSPSQIFSPDQTNSNDRGYLFPDLDIVLHLPRHGQQAGQQHLIYKGLVELKRNISRRFLFDLLSLDGRGRAILMTSLVKAITQVELQAVFVYARSGVDEQGRMVLIAGVGPFWTCCVVDRSDFERINDADNQEAAMSEDEYFWETDASQWLYSDWKTAISMLQADQLETRKALEDLDDRYAVDWDALALFSISAQDLLANSGSKLHWQPVRALGSVESDNAIRHLHTLMATF